MIDITGILDPHTNTQTSEKISSHKQLVERLQQAILLGRLPQIQMHRQKESSLL